jgi:KDO2-lipid IV(A) lauroyltransferase
MRPAYPSEAHGLNDHASRYRHRVPDGNASDGTASRLIHAGVAGVGALPARAAYALADAASLGVLVWSSLHDRRVRRLGRGIRRNQRIVYRGDLDPRAARRLHRAWARHLARLSADVASLSALPHLELAKRFDLSAVEGLRAVLAEGRGLIAVTGHIGVWELLAQVPALTGIPLTVVARPTGHPAIDALLDGARRRGGARVVHQKGALSQLFTALEGGQVVGLLADENRAVRPIFAPFLGTMAATSPAAARLQHRAGAPIAVVSCQRTGTRRYRLAVWDLIRPAEGESTDVQQVCARTNDALSRAIRACPAQWLWSSRRFHTRPAGERPGADGLPPPAAA